MVTALSILLHRSNLSKTMASKSFDFKRKTGERIAQFVNDPDGLVEFLRPIADRNANARVLTLDKNGKHRVVTPKARKATPVAVPGQV